MSIEQFLEKHSNSLGVLVRDGYESFSLHTIANDDTLFHLFLNNEDEIRGIVGNLSNTPMNKEAKKVLHMDVKHEDRFNNQVLYCVSESVHAAIYTKAVSMITSNLFQ